MGNYKYITYRYSIYVFPPHEDHSNFAKRNKLDTDKIHGAGFIAFYDGKAICSGKSISLGISKSDLDDKIANNKLIEY